MGVCYRPPNHDEEADEIFYKQLGEDPPSLALILMGNFRCLLEVQHIREETFQEMFLESVEETPLTELVREPTREGVPLELLFVSREGLVDGQRLSWSQQSQNDSSQFSKYKEHQQNSHHGLTEGRFWPVSEPS